MTNAQYWLFICETRVTSGSPSLLQDTWCSALLSEASETPAVNCGPYGKMWTFTDGSTLVASPDGVVTTRALSIGQR